MKKVIWFVVIPAVMLSLCSGFAQGNNPPFQPDVVVYPDLSNCTETGLDLISFQFGPNPPDPNPGDPVTYNYEWYRDATGTGQYEPYLNPWETWLPGYLTVVGEQFQIVVTPFDGSGTQGESSIETYNVIVEECLDDYDMGDIDYFYPTNVLNPAHKLTGIAWLGEAIDAETLPWTFPYNPYNSDLYDDGVIFSDPYGTMTGTPFAGVPWMPCTQETLAVIVHADTAYVGQPMWVNIWKDGNLDYDFDDGPDQNGVYFDPPEDDYLCFSEWIVQDAMVSVPGPSQNVIYTYVIDDPGDTQMGVYDLHLRVRLSYTALGRYGYGLGGPNSYGNFDVDEYLGEVEDYAIEDGQLPVELTSFEAVPGNGYVTLSWTTASEVDNDHFEIMRSTGIYEPVTIGTVIGGNPMGASYEFVDSRVTNGVTYKYVLVDVDINGMAEAHYDMEVTATPNTLPIDVTPTDYALHQNFPNPFNPTTTLVYDVVDAGYVSLMVFDVLGRQVATLVDGEQVAGRYPVTFDASDLASGIYFYRLQVNGYSDMKKMVVIK